LIYSILIKIFFSRIRKTPFSFKRRKES
jgi:hypothetical protein